MDFVSNYRIVLNVRINAGLLNTVNWRTNTGVLGHVDNLGEDSGTYHFCLMVARLVSIIQVFAVRRSRREC